MGSPNVSSEYPPAQESGEPESLTPAQQLLELVAERLVETVHVNMASFFVYDESGQRTIYAAWAGVHPENIVLPRRAFVEFAPEDVKAEIEIRQTKRPLHCTTPEDYDRYPPVNPVLRRLGREGALTSLAVPLLWEDTVIGVVYLWRWDPPKPFTPEEQALAEELAQLAIVAIQFNRLYDAERIQREQLHTLLEISQVVAGMGSLESILPVVTHALKRTLSADAAILAIYDEVGFRLLDYHSEGLTDEGAVLIQQALQQHPIRTLPRDLFPSTAHSEITLETLANILGPNHAILQRAHALETSRILMLPVVDREMHLGIFFAWRYRDETGFAPSAVATAEAIVRTVAGAITRARLQERTEQHVAELEALWALSQTIHGSTSMSEALDLVATVIRRFISFDAAIVAEPDIEQKEFLRVTWAWGVSARPERGRLGRTIPIAHSLAGQVYRTGKAVNVADAHADPRTYAGEGGFKLHAVLIEPLLEEGTVVGIFGIGRSEPQPFSSEEARLFAVLAQEASTALALLKARAGLEQRERAQRFLAELGELLLQYRDPATFLPAAVRRAAGVLGEAVACYLWSPANGNIEQLYSAHADPHRSQVVHEILHQLDLKTLRILLSDTEGTAILRRGATTVSAALQPLVEQLLEAAGAELLIGVPLRQQDHQVGLLMSFCTAAGPDVTLTLSRLLRTAADRLSTALDRWQSEQARDALLRTSQALMRQFRLADALEAITTELQRVLPYDRFIVYIAEPEAQQLRPWRYSHHYESLFAQTPTIPYGSGIAGLVALTHRAELVNDARNDPRVLFPPETEPDLTLSLMVGPLVADDELLGVLLIGRPGRNQFNSYEFTLFQLFANQAALALREAQQRERERQLYLSSVQALAATVDAKDPYTHNHSRNVARYARMIAETLGCSPDEVEQIELAGLLHDIGKIGIPDHLLTKPGKLTPEEWAVMQTHAERGAVILATHPALAPIVPLVRHHHERWDGHGYPDGLKGEDIPLGAAIIGLADAFDTMTSDRPYRKAMPVEEAIAEIRRCSGTQFHPRVVAAFLQVFTERSLVSEGEAVPTPPHSLVSLSELTVLHTIGERLEDVRDFHSLARIIDESLSTSLSGNAVNIFLYDQLADALVLRYSRAAPEQVGQIVLPRKHGMSWQAFTTRQPVVVNDAEHDPRVVRFLPNTKTMLAAPLLDSEQAIGVITVVRTTPEPFTDQDAAILATIGRRVGPLVARLATTTREQHPPHR